MQLEIVQPGLMTTVQDRGRTGSYHLGVPQGGALDRYSYELANALVGNLAGEAVLECAYMGPHVRALGDTTVAVTGAPVAIQVNGDARPAWERIELREGDVLSFGVVTAGMRFFIAVAGGIDVPEVLGSRSTYLAGGFGGFEGRKLESGDLLPVGEPGAPPTRSKVSEALRPAFEREQTVRIVLGPYDHRLSGAGMAALTESEWTLTPVADRMGLRYDGPGVEWLDREQPFGAGSDASNIVDAGYAVGSIQIPGGTQPIVLHRDAVSGGGYATVGTVVSADMDLVARATPGTRTRFRPVEEREAVDARRAWHESIREAVASVTS